MILYTFSKKFAMTGWRLGCAAAPVPVAEQIAKLNTNDESCTTHFVQAAGVEALRDPIRVGARSSPSSSDGATPPIDALARRAGRALRQAGGDVLPVPERHRGGRPHGLRHGLRLRHRRAAQHGRVVLHPPSLRPRPAGRDREHYIRLAYSGISADDITEGIGLLGRVGASGGT